MTITVVLDTDAERLTVYLDGVAVGSGPTQISANELINSSATLGGYLGASFYNDPTFRGVFEDVRIYRSALSDEQVGALAGGAVPQFESLTSTEFDVRTGVGEAPVLPATAQALFSDGYTRSVPIAWDSVDPAQYASFGEFTVSGQAAGHSVTATVLVHRGELRVNLGASTGEFLGGASGLLYGLYGDGMPTENLIEGMNIRTVATKAQDGSQHPGSDALEILPTLAAATDGDVYLRITDWYRGFPYQWPGSTPEQKLDSYRQVLNEQLDMIDEIPLELHNNLVIEPYNEPEGNMFGTGPWSYDGTSWLNDPTDYFASWDETYRTIKDRFPHMRIAGPGTSILFGQVEGFLEHAIAEDTVPDIITWHELTHPQSIRDSVDMFRGWEDRIFAGTAYDGVHLPINVNEYAFNYHTSVPGQMVQWMSAIEDSKVDAMIAFWNINGNLSDSAVQTNRGNGQWWLYNAYANMTGDTVEVTPPKPGENYSLQGLATLDEGKQQARVLMGGADGAAPVDVVNVPADLFGDQVRVWVREIPWTGQLGDSPEPVLLAETVVPITDGTVSIEFGTAGLPELIESSAYELVVTPAGSNADGTPTARWSSSYEAEDANYLGEPYFLNGPEGSSADVAKFYTSGGYNVGGLRTGSTGALTFEVDVPENGTYDLQVFASTENVFHSVQEQGPTNVFLTVDGGAEQELFLPLGYKWVVWDHVDTTVELTAGTHQITLAANSRDGTGSTKGDALIDRIVLTKAQADDAVMAYEAELAEVSHGLSYGAGASGSGVVNVGVGESATFWVYGKVDGEASLEVDGTGSGTVSINGHEVLDLGSNNAAAVHLFGGINKIEVHGPAVVDRLVVGGSTGALARQDIQAEDAVLAGDAQVVDLSLAEGGRAVANLGGAPGNTNTVTFNVDAAHDGVHAVVVRFSNPEQVPATHYNPNPMARRAMISVNEQAPMSVLFVPTFHENNFWERTLLLELEEGSNTIMFGSQEQPNFDGVTYAQDYWPGIPLRADQAPIIDQITLSPIVAAIADGGDSDNGSGDDGNGDGGNNGGDNGGGTDEPGDGPGKGEPGDGSGNDGSGGTDVPARPDSSDLDPALESAVSGPPVIARGERFTVRVPTWLPGTAVCGWLMSDPVALGSDQLSGTSTAQLTAPGDAPLGEHRLVVTDPDGDVIGWYAVTVVDSRLATTGTDIVQAMAPWVLALIMSGAGLVLTRRFASQP